MTEAQASQVLLQHRATFVTTKDGLEWWRLPSGDWLAVKKSGGQAVVRQVPKSACNCG